MPAPPELLQPTSESEAIGAFGDGAGVTVVSGGTIVVPDMTYGRLRPSRVVLLTRAGMGGVTREAGVVRIGAGTPVGALDDAVEPLGSAARGVADGEIRAAGTVGGNLCAGPAQDAPRGDLQAPLIALGATVRSAGKGGERSDPIESFLGNHDGRLVLSVEFAEPVAAGYARMDRKHAHTYTMLAVSACRAADGSVRVAASGVGPFAVRLTSVEAVLAERWAPEAAAKEALVDCDPPTDALASAWYRKRMLPLLITRALEGLA